MKRYFKLALSVLLCAAIALSATSCNLIEDIKSLIGRLTVVIEEPAVEPTAQPSEETRSENAYQGERWIDKSDAFFAQEETLADIEITAIYSDCFFAQYIIPLPYNIKINGQLSDEWHVGDHVSCKVKNSYSSEQTGRVEADLVSIEPSDFELEPNIAYKPVIYLYPEQETEVSVKLSLDGDLLCSYPAYDNGWTVTASPDGTLTDDRGTEYSYLFWEAELNADYDFSHGFCVKGSDTAAFLERALSQLGLNRKEANEFIVFWLMKMRDNPYNVISFQTDAYTDAAGLDITPAPDTTIRVFMAWYASDEYVNLPAQELTAPERSGFTAVEWGGTQTCNK